MPRHQQIGWQLHGFGNQLLSMSAAAAPAFEIIYEKSVSCLPRIRKPGKGVPMSVLELDRTAPKPEGGDSAAKTWLRALAATAPIATNPARTLPALIEELGETYGDAPALLSDRETLTYRELAARANRYARW